MSSLTEPASSTSSHIICCCCKKPVCVELFTPGERRRNSPRCQACVKEKNQSWASRNRDVIKKNNVAYYQANRESVSFSNKLRYAKNKEQYTAKRVLWWERNKAQINSARRYFKSINTWRSWVWRLKKLGLSPDGYQSILESQGNACAICSTTEPGKVGGSGSLQRVFAVDHCHSSNKV